MNSPLASQVLALVGIITALATIWSQPIPEYLKSLGISLLAVLLLFIYVNDQFVKKSEKGKK